MLNNIGNGVQVKLNKASSGDSASFLYQTNWSGRAEFGTTGDDDFHIKVSPDGSNWHESLVIDRNSGFLNFHKEIRSWGGGILFNGSGSRLNAYEEGSWTPVLHFGTTAGTPTYSIQQGKYTIIGDRCFVSCRVQLSSKGGGVGVIYIDGLPFNIKAGAEYRASPNIGYYFQCTLAANEVMNGYGREGTDEIRLRPAGNAGTPGDLVDTEINDTFQIYLDMSYKIA